MVDLDSLQSRFVITILWDTTETGSINQGMWEVWFVQDDGEYPVTPELDYLIDGKTVYEAVQWLRTVTDDNHRDPIPAKMPIHTYVWRANPTKAEVEWFVMRFGRPKFR